MAIVTSTSSSAATQTGSTSSGRSSGVIDVAAIADSLVESRSAPLRRVVNQISQSSIAISSLGEFRSKIAKLQTAVDSLESLSSRRVASSGNESIISATASSTASTGTYFVEVSKIEYRSGALVADLVVNGTSSTGVPVNTGGTSISGVTLKINGVGSTVVRVANSSGDSLTGLIEEFVDAFNEVVTFYKNATSSQAGTEENQFSLLGNSTAASFYDRLRRSISGGSAYGASATVLSLEGMGLRLNDDGQLSINSTKLDAVLADGLADKFASGIIFGAGVQGSSMSSILEDASSLTGSIAQAILGAEDRKYALETRQTELQATLDRLRERYVLQYSRLDAELLKLQSISNSLDSLFGNLSKGFNANS